MVEPVFNRVTSLPPYANPNSFYIVRPVGSLTCSMYVTGSDPVPVLVTAGGATSGVASFNTRTGAVSLTSGDVTTALGFTPLGTLTSGAITTALGFTPYDAANPSGFISGITSGMVTTALGFTPYSAANPAGYISSITSVMVTSALGYVPTSVTGLTGQQTIAAFKTGLSLVKADVGLGNVDNTADLSKSVASAAKLTTARNINGVLFDGTADITIPAGSGTVTSVAVATANGVSGTVANASTTPSITLALGAITPSSVVATGSVTGSNLSGTNTGDQTSVTGNAGTATKLATARNINGVPFDGTAAITINAVDSTARLAVANNLSDLASASSARTNLGLGTLATQSGTFSGTSSGTNTGDQTVALTGDVTGTGTASFAATLATVNSNTGTFGSTSAVPVITVNGKGLITAVSTAALGTMATQNASGVAITGGTITGVPRTFEIAISTIGTPSASQVLGWYRASRAETLVAANSIGGARVAAAASYTITINRRTTPTGTDSSIGTITYTSGSAVPTFSYSSTAISVGDILSFVGAATADTSLTDPYFSIAGTVT